MVYELTDNKKLIFLDFLLRHYYIYSSIIFNHLAKTNKGNHITGSYDEYE